MPVRRSRNQKVGKALKGFADTRKPSVDLIRDIQKHVVSEGAKNNLERESHKIHVSEVIKDNVCPRYLYYKITGEDTTDVIPSAGARLEMIWAAGNQEHAKWQKWLSDMGDLYGTWRCVNCDVMQGPSEYPTSCPGSAFDNYTCDSSRFVYDELHLEVPDVRLVGHADAAVPRLRTLVEVKSFSVGTTRIEHPELVKRHTHKVGSKTLTDIEGIWGEIKRPFKSHIKQGVMYLWMCKQMDLPYDRIVFIYENKTTQATKTFEIKLVERMIAEPLKILADVNEAAELGEIPSRPRLFAKDAKPCNACPYRSLCYSSEEETNDDNSAESAPVPARRSRTRSQEAGREAEVPPTRASRRRDPEGSRGHHRPRRPGPDRADDEVHGVDRAPRRATGDGRGGRESRRGLDGEGTRSRFSRSRQGRDRA